jgi:hypothetical protein
MVQGAERRRTDAGITIGGTARDYVGSYPHGQITVGESRW